MATTEACRPTVWLPASKSIAARALLLRHLYAPATAIEPLPRCDDIDVLACALDAVSGGAGYVDVRDSGTALRFMLALLATPGGARRAVVLDGSARIRRRPVAALAGVLRRRGATVDHLSDPRHAPLLVIPPARVAAGMEHAAVPVGESSQFASAMMLVAPACGRTARIDFDCDGHTPPSLPYLAMTAGVMRAFGFGVAFSPRGATVCQAVAPPPARFEVEADWSAAAFMLEAASLTPGLRFRIGRLTPPSVSIQGDSRAAALFGMLGVRTEFAADGSAEVWRPADAVLPARIDLDMAATPDLVPPLAVAAALLGVPFRLTGTRNLALKESARGEALAAGLARLSLRLVVGADSLSFAPPSVMPRHSRPVVIDTYGDHRMAMAFAPAASLYPGLRVARPEVVAKSFPDYFDQLAALNLPSVTPI